MIYADAGIIIRLIEGAAKVRSPIEVRLQAIRSQGPLILTSRLSRLECRCKPLRNRQERLLRQYEIFFSGQEVDIREIDAAVVEKAKLLLAGGKWGEAITVLEPLANRTPCDAEAAAYTALAWRQLKQPEKARACLNAAL